MHVVRTWRWSALAVAFGFAASAALAGMITPDSIPNPPASLSSTNGTTVNPSNLITTQYAGLGLDFTRTAITNLNGVAAWTPVAPVWGNSSSNPSSEIISYYGEWAGGKFVLPGSSVLATVSFLSVGLVGQRGAGISVYGLNGQQLNILPVISAGPHGGEVWTFTGTGISSFDAFTPVADGLPNYNPAWGVAEVSFTPSSTPEPSSLVLAGLGVLGLVTRRSCRRIPSIA